MRYADDATCLQSAEESVSFSWNHRKQDQYALWLLHQTHAQPNEVLLKCYLQDQQKEGSHKAGFPPRCSFIQTQSFLRFAWFVSAYFPKQRISLRCVSQYAVFCVFTVWKRRCLSSVGDAGRDWSCPFIRDPHALHFVLGLLLPETYRCVANRCLGKCNQCKCPFGLQIPKFVKCQEGTKDLLITSDMIDWI